MAINNQFSIAVHLMAGLGLNFGKDVTSTSLAQSVNASHSFVRRTLAKLSKARLVNASKGKFGKTSLAKEASQISLLDIYRAVEAPKAFSIHTYPPNASCPISCGIKPALEKVLSKTQRSMEESLSQVRLSEVISDLR